MKHSEPPTLLETRMNDDRPAGAEEPPPSAPLVEFYIPATSSLQVRRPRILKHGDTFGVFDHYGDILPAEGSTEGIYHQDTRYLSGLQLLINGRRPLLLSSIVQDNNALLTADLTNPDFFDAAGRLRPAARTRSTSCARSSSGRRGSMNASRCATSTIAPTRSA